MVHNIKIERVCKEIKTILEDEFKSFEKEKRELQYYKEFYNQNRALVDYANYYMLDASGSLTITEIAEKYNISAKKLNRILVAANAMFMVGNRCHLTKEYENMGYTVPERNSHCFRYWTRKGEFMIYQILAKKGIYPVAA